MTTLAFFGTIGGWELLALAIIGLLIFGKRLPEVGKSLGKGIVEFKKGLSGIEDEVNSAGQAPAKPAGPESSAHQAAPTPPPSSDKSA